MFDNHIQSDTIISMTMTMRQKIKIELIKKGIPAAEVARRMGVSRQAIYQTIDGIIKSRRLRKAIAEAIGVEVTELWPANDKGQKSTPLPQTAGDKERR